MGMEKFVKKAAVALMATALVFGSANLTAEAKGTAFINKKVSSVTPKITSCKRTAPNKATVKVSIPSAKVKKVGAVKKITVAYGSKKGNKFEAVKTQVKVKKVNKNTYSFDLKAKNLVSFKDTFVTCRLDGKTNWSALKTLSNKGFKYKKVKTAGETISYMVYKCNTCGMVFDSHDSDANCIASGEHSMKVLEETNEFHSGFTFWYKTYTDYKVSYKWVKEK